jgi:hypothetical protein
MSNLHQVEPVPLEELEQKLRRVDDSVLLAARLPKLTTLLVETRSMMTYLLDARSEKCRRVAQLVRTDQLDAAIRTMTLIFERVREPDICEVIWRAYEDAADMAPTLRFLGSWTFSSAQRMVLVSDSLYMHVLQKGHADQPQILLLRDFMAEARHSSESHLELPFRQVVVDCERFVGRVSAGIRAHDFSLGLNLVQSLGVSFACRQIDLVVLYLYADASLEDTVLLLQFALQMAHARIQCTVVAAAASSDSRCSSLLRGCTCGCWRTSSTPRKPKSSCPPQS